MKYVNINGSLHKLPDLIDLSYTRLCLLSGVPDSRQPTVTWSLPDGRCGTVIPGQRAPLEQGAVYNVAVTGAA